MNKNEVDVIIIGAGLSGLLTANRLKKKGYSVLVIEGKEQIGGRIHTIESKNGTLMEMGATWYNNQHVQLTKLLQELNLKSFEQYTNGLSFFYHSENIPTESFVLPTDSSSSLRIAGGTNSIIKILADNLNENELQLNSNVTEIHNLGEDKGIEVKAENVFYGKNVILTVSPRMWSNTIKFHPSLPINLIDLAKNVHTWMSESAKIALTYSTPFWKENKLSGVVFSNIGPITEFYDHSDYREEKFALCGFMNPQYSQYSLAQRKEKVLLQLQKIFGADALKYIEYQEYFWGNDSYVNRDYFESLIPHQNNGHFLLSEPQYNGKLMFSGTETAYLYAGYMEGAIISSNTVSNQFE